MSFPRLSGILLHPISLPSRGGIGDLGPAAYEFVDFLAEAKQGLWQVLPLNPPAKGNSPYSSTSAFAGNPQLISVERLAQDGWLDQSAVAGLPTQVGPIDYEQVNRDKLPLIRAAAGAFLDRASEDARINYQNFCIRNEWWLPDYVAFDLLRERHGPDWSLWPSQFARREPAALHEFHESAHRDLELRRVMQFFFWEHWRKLRDYCKQKSIRIAGDIAIFVDYDSADVWANRELFRLKDDLQPQVVSGVPPDYFSATGQRWGNPLYNWDAIRSNGYDWWVKRLRWATQTCDFIRLDHFRGFAQFWEIPASEPTAIKGRWVDGPGDEFFNKIREELGGLPFFAEDLGYITPDVIALRDGHNIPGMAVLQFAFGDAGAHAYLPHRLNANRVIYTGTHDNDTTRGWYATLPDDQRRNLLTYLKRPRLEAPEAAGELMRLAWASVAALAVVPLQDLLNLDSSARMNRPGEAGGNWDWRVAEGMLDEGAFRRLRQLTEEAKRLPTGR
jgi:4-alpha-glucanotransferase